MRLRGIFRILGLLICLFSATLLPPAVVAVIYEDGGGMAFMLAFAVSILLGFVVWYPNRHQTTDLKVRDGFLLTVLFWTVLGMVGFMPLWFAEELPLSVTDAVFESFSGLTTTGATVIQGIEHLPHSILFYRQQLQWLGGMGIIVLAVAILPMLGIGGMQLYRTEIPGPLKDAKLTPRIADTAKHLWYIYVALTAACAIAYKLAGMSWFDAIGHSFSTIAVGGFSTYDASMGYFDSSTINTICVVFLLLSSMNFAVHYASLTGRTARSYWNDPEVRAFLLIQLALVLIVFATVLLHNIFSDVGTAFNQAMFQAVSISTTAGFATTNFSAWPLFLPILLVFASFIGGCASSTAGGLKVVRVLLLFRQGVRELNRLVHPAGVYTVKLGQRILAPRVVEAVWGFFAAYALVFVVIMLGLLATGMDDLTAFSATAACLNNLGPGLGDVAANYSDIPDTAKWLLVIAMLFGRLEVFTILVLLTPTFWRS
ncbi:potassium transporter [Pseudidiomarina salinarum]|uniref:Trk system potassium uptake protein n=1 Tax=Pseudidiomarina salinarum TaxID=435908 RepID=A0A094IYL7_9GAMM|nr:TrkH family potassium uptake protein [Pseudidiomarina salinarum]KFZ30899.1 potassium transporter [Pseudidiomarina salinarum]RUO71380.1 potassium transporter [Pseudidiomarina salinarum]